MKSKNEIHKAIAVLTIIAMRSDGDVSLRASKICSALCWVMDYPNNFDKFMEKVDRSDLMDVLDLSPERLEQVIQESIAAVKNKEGEGFGE